MLVRASSLGRLVVLGVLFAAGCGAVAQKGDAGAGGSGGSGGAGGAGGGVDAGGGAGGAGGGVDAGGGAGGGAPDGAQAATDSSAGDASTDAARCVPSPAGLQARWRGEMNAKDDTGVFNGTAMGGIGYGPGRHGSAFILDGVDDLVTADPSDALYPPASFSAEAWVNTRKTGVFMAIVSKYDCGGSDACSGSFWALYVDPDGHGEFQFRVNGSPTNVVIVTASVQTINDGAWHHLVGVRDVTSAQAILYIDGSLAISRAISGADVGAINNADGASDPLTIGAGRVSGVNTYTDYFTGAIDEVAYYTHAMTAAEVAALYGAPDGVCP